MQVGAVFRPQHRSATGGHDRRRALSELVNDRRLKVSKRLLAFAFEKLSNRTAEPLLNHVIGVDEGKRKTTSELAPHSRLTGPRQADKKTRRWNAQLIAERPSTRGVMKISSSFLLEIRLRDLNKLPTAGRSPNKGTLLT